MEDFPLQSKVLIWLVVGGTVVYAAGEMIYYGRMVGQVPFRLLHWRPVQVFGVNMDYVVLIVVGIIAAMFVALWLSRG